MNMIDVPIPSEEPSLSPDAPFFTYTHDKKEIIRRTTSDALQTKFFTDFLTHLIRFLTSRDVEKTTFHSFSFPKPEHVT
jgi:hypothetical protein